MKGNKDITDEMSQAYIAAATEETPDLWSRVERGFEDELAGMQRGKAAGSRRVIHWKRYAGIAAVVLICVIVIPLMMGNREKSSDMDSYVMLKSEEQTVAGEGIQSNDMDEAPEDFGYSMDDTEASIEYFTENTAENSAKASAEETTDAVAGDIGIISIVGRCRSVKN